MTQHSLAVVIPVYNEAKTIEQNFQIVQKTLEHDGLEAKYMLVDDGSRDQTWPILCKIAQANEAVSCIRFSRNFGKEAAICAGLEQIDAAYYVVMDCDLQHPPRHVGQMMDLALREDADVVEGMKTSRGREGFLYKIFAKSFYKLLRSVSGLNLDNSSDFKLLRRNVVDSIRGMGEGNVFFRGLVDWVGFSHVTFSFDVEERKGDTTKFSTRKLISLALSSILSFTSKPLYITVLLGALFFVVAVILGIQTLYNFLSGRAVSGFSTVILLQLLTGSLILISLGIIGLYLGRIYDQTKGRPKYIISDRRGKNDE